MFDIDIERLMDLLNEESDAYFDYCHKRNKLYDGNFDAWAERKENLEYARQRCDRAEDAVQAVAEIFRLNKDQVKRLYIAGRAIKKWRIRTEWAQFLSDEMQKQIKYFIFGDLPAPSLSCKYCGRWKEGY